MADNNILKFADVDALKIPEAFKNVYMENLELGYQSDGNKLLPTVTQIPGEKARGEKLIYDYLDPWDLDEITDRNANTVYSDAAMKRREVGWAVYGKAVPIDETDPIALLLDPQWAVLQNHKYAVGRRIDKSIGTALFATVVTGHKSDGTAAWAASNADCKILAHNSQGLTKEKILAAKAALEAADVDLGDPRNMPTLLCHANDANALLTDSELKSVDYMRDNAYVTGKIQELYNIRLQVANHAVPEGAGFRRCGLYVKSAMACGIPKPAQTYVVQNAQKWHRWEISVKVAVGALRLYDKGVVEIQTIDPPLSTLKKAS
jgi:hypothetical protein